MSNTGGTDFSASSFKRSVENRRKTLRRLFGQFADEISWAPPPPVRNNNSCRVTNYIIAVKRLSDAKALLPLLKKNGYEFGYSNNDSLIYLSDCNNGDMFNLIVVLSGSRLYYSLLNLREYLSENKARKKEFDSLQGLLAKNNYENPTAYLNGIRQFIEKLSEEARIWKIFSRSLQVKITQKYGSEADNGETLTVNIGTAESPGGDKHVKAYIFGENRPINKFTGKVIAVITSLKSDEEEIWAVASPEKTLLKPEIQEILNKHGEDTSSMHFTCLYEKSCGAVVYFDKKKEPLYLLIKNRSQNMGFPKGHVELNEDEAQTALREIKEETNLSVTLDGDFREYYNYPINFFRKKQAVYFIAKAKDGRIIIPKNEILSYSILPYNDAIKMLAHGNEKKVLKDAHKHILKNRGNVGSD